MYACAADKVSGGDCDAYTAGCTFPPEQFGTVLCSKVLTACDGCPLDVAFADHNAGWLRDDVRAAASACLELFGCFEKLNCLEAWQYAAFPGRSS